MIYNIHEHSVFFRLICCFNTTHKLVFVMDSCEILSKPEACMRFVMKYRPFMKGAKQDFRCIVILITDARQNK